jgi:hypothetical protein
VQRRFRIGFVRQPPWNVMKAGRSKAGLPAD